MLGLETRLPEVQVITTMCSARSGFKFKDERMLFEKLRDGITALHRDVCASSSTDIGGHGAAGVFGEASAASSSMIVSASEGVAPGDDEVELASDQQR